MCLSQLAPTKVSLFLAPLPQGLPSFQLRSKAARDHTENLTKILTERRYSHRCVTNKNAPHLRRVRALCTSPQTSMNLTVVLSSLSQCSDSNPVWTGTGHSVFATLLSLSHHRVRRDGLLRSYIVLLRHTICAKMITGMRGAD